MRWLRGEDITYATEAVRTKIVGLTHNNEKHVDDFASESTLEVIDVQDNKTSKSPSKGGKGSNRFSSSKSTKDAEADMRGADPIVKTYYEGIHSREGAYDWSEVPPRMMSKKQALKADRVALKLYKVKDTDKPVVGGRFVLKNHMLEIQNPSLITAIKPILKKQDTYLDTSETARFMEPFRALYFSADEIIELQQQTPDNDPVKQQLLLLVRVMGELFGNLKSTIRQLQTNGLMNFKNAWIYFPKDCVVYRPGKDTERVWKVVDTTYKTQPCSHLMIKVKEILFDGTTYNWVTDEFPVLPWEGNKPITEVSCHPLAFQPDAAEISRRMIERGKKVLDYQGLSYCSYTGVAFLEQNEKVEKHNVSGPF